MSAKSTLSPQFIAAQRKRLEALKAELLGADSTAQEETRAGQEDGGAEAEEYEDAAQVLDLKEVLQARHDVDQPRLANIDRALKKIELGTYGLWYFICNTPSAYAVISVLHRPVESATHPVSIGAIANVAEPFGFGHPRASLSAAGLERAA